MTSTTLEVTKLSPYYNAVAIGNVSLPLSSPSNGQTIAYNAATNQWQYQNIVAPVGSVDLTTNQTVGGIKSFTNIINANAGLSIPSTFNITINTPSAAGPEIQLVQNVIDTPLSLTSGLRLRRPDNLAYFQFAWDASGFTLYRVDAGVPAAITTLTGGRFTALLDPQNPQDACTKNYADAFAKKEMCGFIPILTTTPTTTDSVKTGFFATASSVINTANIASNPFNGIFSTAGGGECATNGVTSNFWIQIQCPVQTRIWKIALRGKNTNLERIFDWRIEGSNDGIAYTTLFTATNPTFLGNTMQQFQIVTALLFSYYRLFAVQGEAPNPGLSYMQIYVYSQ